MTGVLIGQWTPLSPEWHAARLGGIGGSEIAAVLGLSPWESRFSLWHRKQGRIPAQPENDEMEAGKRLEDAICGKFADSHPEYQVTRAGTYRHADRPWQIGNPDRLLYDLVLDCSCHAHGDEACSDTCTGPTDWIPAVLPAAILEAKFVLYADEYGDPGTDQVPPYVLAQCRWYLEVLGLPVCYVQVFVGSSGQFREYVIRPDPADTATMLAAGEEFMASLTAGVRPPIDSHNETYQAVRHMHPDIQPVDVELDGELARAYCTARHALKEAKAEDTRCTSLVADAVGDGRRAVFLGQPLACRQARGEGVPYLAAARNLPSFTEEETPA